MSVPDKKKIVAIIEPVGSHGGMNFYDFGLAAGLAESGMGVVLYTNDGTMKGGPYPFRVKNYFERIYGKAHPILRGMRYLIGMTRSLIDAKRERAGTVHFHLFHTTALEFVSILEAKMLGHRIVITAHDVESFMSGGSTWVSKMIYGLTDRIIAHNKVSARELIERLQVSKSKISVIPHGNYLGVIRNDITREEARRELGLPMNNPILLFFGQIKEVKGLDLLLTAFANIVHERPDARLVIAGKVWKTDFSKYQDIIDRLALSDYVLQDIRYIPDSEADLYYCAADAVVLPYYRIYQSGVLLMAMSYRKLVIVSDLPGMVEIVNDGENGVVFKSGCAGDLTRALRETLRATEKCESLAEAGYSYVERVHNWPAIAREIRKSYGLEVHS